MHGASPYLRLERAADGSPADEPTLHPDCARAGFSPARADCMMERRGSGVFTICLELRSFVPWARRLLEARLAYSDGQRREQLSCRRGQAV